MSLRATVYFWHFQKIILRIFFVECDIKIESTSYKFPDIQIAIIFLDLRSMFISVTKPPDVSSFFVRLGVKSSHVFFSSSGSTELKYTLDCSFLLGNIPRWLLSLTYTRIIEI